jgi:hypothetical protein
MEELNISFPQQLNLYDQLTSALILQRLTQLYELNLDVKLP